MRRLFAVLGAVAALSIFAVATPASAATLPSYQRITTIDADGMLYDIDPTTAVATPIWATGIGAASTVTLDDAGRGFVTAAVSDLWDSTLWTVDLGTREVALVGAVTLRGDPATTGACGGLQQVGGELVGYCAYYDAFRGGTNTFARIDPVTAQFTPLITFSRGGTESFLPAIDPADGALIIVVGPSIVDVPPSLIGTTEPDLQPYVVGEFDGYSGSPDFSADGVMWAPLQSLGGGSWSLATWNRATSQITGIGPITTGGRPLEVIGVTVWGAPPSEAARPQLAATGSSPVSVIALIAVLMASGAIALVGARRRRA